MGKTLIQLPKKPFTLLLFTLFQFLMANTIRAQSGSGIIGVYQMDTVIILKDSSKMFLPNLYLAIIDSNKYALSNSPSFPYDLQNAQTQFGNFHYNDSTGQLSLGYFSLAIFHFPDFPDNVFNNNYLNWNTNKAEVLQSKNTILIHSNNFSRILYRINIPPPTWHDYTKSLQMRKQIYLVNTLDTSKKIYLQNKYVNLYSDQFTARYNRGVRMGYSNASARYSGYLLGVADSFFQIERTALYYSLKSIDSSTTQYIHLGRSHNKTIYDILPKHEDWSIIVYNKRNFGEVWVGASGASACLGLFTTLVAAPLSGLPYRGGDFKYNTYKKVAITGLILTGISLSINIWNLLEQENGWQEYQLAKPGMPASSNRWILKANETPYQPYYNYQY